MSQYETMIVIMTKKKITKTMRKLPSIDTRIGHIQSKHNWNVSKSQGPGWQHLPW